MLGYSIEFTLLPFKVCVTQQLWEKYETKKSQFSFTCNYSRVNLVSIIPLLYPEACLAFLGNEGISAMWLCCFIKGRGVGEAKQQE